MLVSVTPQGFEQPLEEQGSTWYFDRLNAFCVYVSSTCVNYKNLLMVQNDPKSDKNSATFTRYRGKLVTFARTCSTSYCRPHLICFRSTRSGNHKLFDVSSPPNFAAKISRDSFILEFWIFSRCPCYAHIFWNTLYINGRVSYIFSEWTLYTHAYMRVKQQARSQAAPSVINGALIGLNGVRDREAAIDAGATDPCRLTSVPRNVS